MCSKGALMVEGAKFGAKVILNSLLGREWQADEEGPVEDVSEPRTIVPVTDSVVVLDSDGVVLQSDVASSVLDMYLGHTQV